MSTAHWEAYYRGGGLVTCPTGPDANYTLEAREVWLEFFGALPDGARIVDIGTGNGPIPLIAKDVASSSARHFEIHGVDLAQIAPVRDVPGGERLFGGIQFHPGTSAERLPFEAESVDAVSGQYVLEYCELPRTLSEVARVLKQGGCAQFITHHGGSVVLRNAEATFAQFQLLFEDLQLFRKLRRLVDQHREAPGTARRQWADAQSAVRVVDSAITARRFDQPILPMARDTAERILRGLRSEPASRLHADIDQAERELRNSWRRLQDLQRGALDDEGVSRVVATAAAAGLACVARLPLVHDAANVIGWRLAFRK